MRSTTKVTPSVLKVPALAGMSFLDARLPASARMGTIMRNRPKSIAIPSVVSQCGLPSAGAAVRPAKALPLLPTLELYA